MCKDFETGQMENILCVMPYEEHFWDIKLNSGDVVKSFLIIALVSFCWVSLVDLRRNICVK